MSRIDAYDAAVHLAEHGCALFSADFASWGGGTGKSGYWLKPGWQQSRPEDSMRVIRNFKKGQGLAMLGGRVLDIVDFDPRNGSEAARTRWDVEGWSRIAVGSAATPSGGEHLLIPATGRRKSSPWQGVDHQAGTPEGQGVGFVWIAPTVKLSKVSNKLVHYRWTNPPTPEEADTASIEWEGLIAELDAQNVGVSTIEATQYEGLERYEDMGRWEQRAVASYAEGIIANRERGLRAAKNWKPGQKDDHGRGWEKLVADAFLAGARVALDPRTPQRLEIIEARLMAAAPRDDSWTIEDNRNKWASQVRAAQRIGAYR